MAGWIHVEHGTDILASIGALKADVDRESGWLSAAKAPLQPPGQAWQLAQALVGAWDQRLVALAQWYQQQSTDLATLENTIWSARTIHQDVEENAADLATNAMG